MTRFVDFAIEFGLFWRPIVEVLLVISVILLHIYNRRMRRRRRLITEQARRERWDLASLSYRLDVEGL